MEESDYVEEESGTDSDSLSNRDIFRVQTIGAVQSAGNIWYAGVKIKFPTRPISTVKKLNVKKIPDQHVT